MTRAHLACPSPSSASPPFPGGRGELSEEGEVGKLGALASYLTSYPSLPSLTMALTFLYRRTRLIANLGLRKRPHRA